MEKKICVDCGMEFVGIEERCELCVKARKKFIKKQLEKIEKILNTHKDWELESGEYNTYEIIKSSKKMMFYFDNGMSDKEFFIQLEELNDDYSIVNICKSIINKIYTEEINYRNKLVKDYNNFNKRKVKMLVNHTTKGNLDKVELINADMIEMYKLVNKYKFEIDEYKKVVSDLYSCMYQLQPNWKVKEVFSYIIDELEDERMDRFAICGSFVDNKIEMTLWEDFNEDCNDDRLLEIFKCKIDSYSDKKQVYREMWNKFKQTEIFKQVI